MADGQAKAEALNAGRMNACEVEFAPEVEPAWQACVGSDADAMTWLAMSYESKKKLKLLGSGVGGYAAMRPHLADDAVTYGAFKVLQGGAAKFVFIASIGPNAGAMVKGRATAHTKSIENALEGTTIGIQATEAEELEPEAVAEKLSKALNAPVTL